MKINIKQIAHDHNITILELSKEIGVSERSMYMWASGKHSILAKHLIKLFIFTKENAIDFLDRYCITEK